MGRREDTWRHTEGERPCGGGVMGGRRERDAATSQEMLNEESRERQGKILPWKLQREHAPTDTLILDL